MEVQVAKANKLLSSGQLLKVSDKLKEALIKSLVDAFARWRLSCTAQQEPNVYSPTRGFGSGAP
ncbi:MAG TPA: hypothetical protein VGJ66_03880 [Pyrinomonadaceae bacterium]